MLGFTPLSGATIAATGGGTSLSSTLYPSAFNALSFGSTVVRGQRFIAPASIGAGALGLGRVDLHSRYVYAGGINGFSGLNFAGDGAGFVDFAIRRRFPIGFNASLFGTAFLSGGVRTVAAPHFDASVFGVAFIAYKLRDISPPFIVATQWGNAQIGFSRTLAPSAFDASLFGVAQLADNRKYVSVHGLAATQIGAAFIASRVRDVYPVGFVSCLPNQSPETRWGRLSIYNKRQFVGQIEAPTTDDGGVFGRWFDVANRNRTIQAYGWRTDKFPLTHLLALKGVALTPSGWVSAQFGRALIAYRVRSIITVGEDTSFFTQWTNARNTAQVQAITGFASLRLGAPSVVNTRRYYPYISVGDQGAFGTHFIAPRVRTLAPYYVYEGGGVTEPLVTLGTRRVVPRGIAPEGIGGATVEEHFTIFAPHWVHVERMGNEGRVHNVTPQIYGVGQILTVWGASAIHNQFEHYAVQGFVATLFGRTLVERREKYLMATGLSALRWGVNTNIRNNTADPPLTQMLLPVGWDGAHVPSSPAGADTGVLVRGNVLYPASLLPMTRYGTARVVRMGIGPAGAIYLLNQFGRPSLNPAQYVFQSGNNHQASYGKPRFSPHTIWAAPAPSQAMANHPESDPFWYALDGAPGTPNDRPFFGRASVTHHTRRLAHYHGDGIYTPDFTIGETWAAPVVSNRLRWIRPVGYRNFRYGIATLNGGGQVEASGDDALRMGAPSVAYYVDSLAPRHLYPQGLNAFGYGQPVASNWRRSVAPVGLDATIIGTARLHPPEPIVPQGFRSDVYGDTFISHYVRAVFPEGVEPLDIGYVAGWFASRMRVRHRDYIAAAPCNNGERVGAPSVSNKVRAIAPTDEIVGIVSAPRVTAQSYVSVAAYGIDAGAFGDVQRWEAGKIKPYGNNMLQPGYPRMGRGINPASMLGVIGAPRLGTPLQPSGIFTQVIGQSTITHADNLDYVCGQLPRAIPAPGLYFGAFGIPVVR